MPYKDPEKKKQAAREAGRRYYARNIEMVKNKARKARNATRSKLRAFVREYKENHPCSDCGKPFPAEAMHFDHVPERGEKIEDIANMIANCVSFKKLLAEIEKCDVVCANDHAVRGARRRAEKLANLRKKAGV